MNNKKLEKIIWETYELLYKASEPSVDFNKLVKEAKINKMGQKEIPYNDYLISQESFNEILDNQIKKYKLKSFNILSFKNTITLGCSPKFKK